MLIYPIIPSRLHAVSSVVKSFPPRISQSMEVKTVANTILAEVNQRGVIPWSANSMNRKVEPHTIPNVDIITQCFVWMEFSKNPLSQKLQSLLVKIRLIFLTSLANLVGQ